jgi:soluble lytic murein transglycosylase
MVIGMSPSIPCILLSIILGFASMTPVALATTTELERQRAAFLAAERALRQGAITRFNELSAELGDYPLYPYLRYQYLRPRLGQAREAEIAGFVSDYAGSPLSSRLHHAWIDNLARRGQWETLLRNYPAHAESAALECYRRQALLRTGAPQQAFDGIESLWLVGRSQPAACDPVFSAWRAQDGLDSGLAWQRFRLAMRANEVRLASYLTRYMDDTHRDWAELWLRVHREPRLVNGPQRPAMEHPVHNDIVIHGIKRMARTNIDLAIETWDRAVNSHPALSREEHADVEHSLALTLAVRSHPRALERLRAIDDTTADTPLREWRVRTAIARHDWHAVIEAIEQLREEERESPTWRYWQAQALERLEQHQQAEELYLELAISRGYYSYLAADRLSLPYQLQHQPIPREDGDSVRPEEYPGLARARELYYLGRLVDARREWFFATRDMADWQLQSAAVQAQGWGWHDRAIMAVARTEFRDDLELRFPFAYREQITGSAREHGIDPALAFALIRQESAFDPNARSSAGAIGLMQLMPATARQLARYLGMPPPTQTALFDITTNLHLGMAWLRRMLDRYDNQAVALAAYNAGEHRVDNWLPREQSVPADLWIETIPFRETRGYVQNVMLFSVIYEQRMDQRDGKLDQRMPAVIPRNARLTRDSASGEAAATPRKEDPRS